MDPNTSVPNPEAVSEKERMQNSPVESAVAQDVSPVIEAARVPEKEIVSPERESSSKQAEPAPVASAPITTPKISPRRPVTVLKKDRLEKEIEEVLEEDLKDLYAAMPPDKQKLFRAKGEETTSAVRTLVQAAHINAKKIFQLIRTWLVIIPGVNRFFLEQEAKIKTDKVLLVTEEEKRRGSKDHL